MDAFLYLLFSMKRQRKAALKKAPGAPKRFKSPYILFSIECREAIKRQLPSQAKVTEIMSKIAETWRKLSEKERRHWEALAERDRARYDSEMSRYQGPLKVPRVRPRRYPDQPKRATSAFMQFVRSVKARVRQQHPEMSNSEIMKMLTEQWRSASKEDKLPFLEKEREERAIYKTAMEQWQKETGRVADDASHAPEEGRAMSMLPSPGTEGREKASMPEQGITTTVSIRSTKAKARVPPPPVTDGHWPSSRSDALPACEPVFPERHEHAPAAQPAPSICSQTGLGLPTLEAQHQEQRQQQQARQQLAREQQERQHRLQQQQLEQKQLREQRENKHEHQWEREAQVAEYEDDSFLMDYLNAAHASFAIYDNFMRGIETEAAAALAISSQRVSSVSAYASSSGSTRGQNETTRVASKPPGSSSSFASGDLSRNSNEWISGGDSWKDHTSSPLKQEPCSDVKGFRSARSPATSPVDSCGALSDFSAASALESHGSCRFRSRDEASVGGGWPARGKKGPDEAHHSSSFPAIGAASSVSGESSVAGDDVARKPQMALATGRLSTSALQTSKPCGREDIPLPQIAPHPPVDLGKRAVSRESGSPLFNRPRQGDQLSRPLESAARGHHILGLLPATPCSPSKCAPLPVAIVEAVRPSSSAERHSSPFLQKLDVEGKAIESQGHENEHPHHPPMLVVTTATPEGGVRQTTYQRLPAEWPPSSSSLNATQSLTREELS